MAAGRAGAADACGGCNSNQYCDPMGSETGGPACLDYNYENSRSDGASGSTLVEPTNKGGSQSVEPINIGRVTLPNFLGSGTDSVSGLVLKVIDFLMKLALPFAVLMLVWAGFQFATAQGNEEKLSRAKKNLLWTVAGIAVILASQAIVGYVTSLLGGSTSADSALIKKVKDFLQQIIGLLFVLVTVYFFWGVVEFVRASGSGDTNKLDEGKRHMVWGIIGMAVMLGAWSIVQILQSVFK